MVAFFSCRILSNNIFQRTAKVQNIKGRFSGTCSEAKSCHLKHLSYPSVPNWQHLRYFLLTLWHQDIQWEAAGAKLTYNKCDPFRWSNSEICSWSSTMVLALFLKPLEFPGDRAMGTTTVIIFYLLFQFLKMIQNHQGEVAVFLFITSLSTITGFMLMAHRKASADGGWLPGEPTLKRVEL